MKLPASVRRLPNPLLTDKEEAYRFLPLLLWKYFLSILYYVILLPEKKWELEKMVLFLFVFLIFLLGLFMGNIGNLIWFYS